MSSSSSMDHDFCELPEDILFDIFVRLPVKTLVRFRMLSKEWNRTITSPAFSRNNYLFGENSAADQIFAHIDHSTAGSGSNYEHFNYTISTSLLYSAINDFQLPPPTRISLPIRVPAEFSNFTTWHIHSTSSCHGMIVMKVLDNFPGTCSVLVWNPVTRQCRNVQWPDGAIRNCYEMNTFFLGLGYDHATDQYKIVMHAQGRTYVMGLKSNNNTWRPVIEENTCWDLAYTQPVTVDGDIYWICSKGKPPTPSRVVKFSVSEEKVTILPPLPEEENNGNDYDNHTCLTWTHGRYKKSYCLFCITQSPRRLRGTRVWTLAQDQDKAAATWTLLMDVSFTPLSGVYNSSYYNVGLFPFGLTPKGHLIIKATTDTTRQFLLYLKSENRFVNVPMDGDPRLMLRRRLYLLQGESLISPFGY